MTKKPKIKTILQVADIYDLMDVFDFKHETGYPTIQQVIAQMLYRRGVTYENFTEHQRKYKKCVSGSMVLGIENELIKLEKWISLPNLPAFKLD